MPASRILAVLAVATLTITSAAHAATYSPEAIDELRFMIEEEKLAHDVYLSFASLYPTIKPFQNIPNSEQTHHNALVTQAGLAGVDVSDSTSLPSNTFQNTSLQSLFSNLVAQGSTSSFAALSVGKAIELKDIDDLIFARSLVPTSSSLYTVYGNLMNGSNNHLNAFNTWLAVTPAPPVPEPETYAMMLAGLALLGNKFRRRQASVKTDSIVNGAIAAGVPA